MYLNKIDFNKRAIITSINIHGVKRKRLYDLGIIPGSVIVKEFESIFRDPICYKIKNTLIALRNEDSLNIEVRYE